MTLPNDPPHDPSTDRIRSWRRANAPRDDVRWDLPADHDADEAPLTLAPPDPPPSDDLSRGAREGSLKRYVPVDEPTGDRWQFTLLHALAANSLLAVVLALTHWMAPTLLAGLLGLTAFGLFLFVTVYQPSQPSIYALVWILVLVYVVAAGVALVRG